MVSSSSQFVTSQRFLVFMRSVYFQVVANTGPRCRAQTRENTKSGHRFTGKKPNSNKASKWRPNLPADELEKRTVIAFGDGDFGTSWRGKKAAAYKVIYRSLCRLQRTVANLKVLLVPEPYSSQVCSKCNTRTLDHMHAHGVSLHAVLKCKTCRTVWNRDCNASRNLFHIATYAAMNDNNVPAIFERKKKWYPSLYACLNLKHPLRKSSINLYLNSATTFIFRELTWICSLYILRIECSLSRWRKTCLLFTQIHFFLHAKCTVLCANQFKKNCKLSAKTITSHVCYTKDHFAL